MMLPLLDALWPRPCLACGEPARSSLCSDCRPIAPHLAPERPPTIDRLYTLGAYEGPLGEVVRRAKLGPDRHAGLALAEALAQALGPLLAEDPPQVVVPMPSPWDRRLARGFHLPSLLALALAAAWNRPMVEALTLSRGAAQRQVGREARRRNLAGRVRSRRPAAGWVLLVDDVATTGASLAAAAQELLGDATKRVTAATLCAVRAAPPRRPPA